MAKLIYLTQQDGTALASAYAVDDGGNVVAIPAGTKIMGYQKVTQESAAKEAVLMTPEQLNQSLSKKQTMDNSFVVAENIKGQPKLLRAETGGFGGSLSMAVALSLTNTTGADAYVLLGDTRNIINILEGFTPTPASPDFEIGGKYGANTVSYLNSLMAYGGAMRVHELQIQAYTTGAAPVGAGDVFAADLVTNYSLVDVVAATVSKNAVNFDINQDGSQYQQNIRRIADARFGWDAFNATLLKIPTGRKVTFNFVLTSVSDANDMKLV